MREFNTIQRKNDSSVNLAILNLKRPVVYIWYVFVKPNSYPNGDKGTEA
jgi:hypothetical protein